MFGDFSNVVIVSRHPAAEEFIRRALRKFERIPKDSDKVRCISEAKDEDVKGKIVFGNIPLHLAAIASAIWTIEFIGDPPRGREYSLDDMIAAKALLREYKVKGPERRIVSSDYFPPTPNDPFDVGRVKFSHLHNEYR